ncbi:hypothetical protein MCA0190 [Methylococcus capsulatus str. Bath]|uniref:Uncharacterized protein n=1 Tax=Methylococcus capsulatus (strain ATCC 33009 / NCIMB 11132 / Bath) TaxID=243233 RepID=Q60CB8_METCA|nr:hypothetical protein MCA0190 [Methylococcus capsulatus str. Bath]
MDMEDSQIFATRCQESASVTACEGINGQTDPEPLLSASLPASAPSCRRQSTRPHSQR